MNNFRYGDDTTLLAENKEDLEKIILKIKDESGRIEVNLNTKKTKIMTTAADGQVIFKNQQ